MLANFRVAAWKGNGLRNLLGILKSRIHHLRCRLVVHSAVGSWPAAGLVAGPAVGLASASSPAR